MNLSQRTENIGSKLILSTFTIAAVAIIGAPTTNALSLGGVVDSVVNLGTEKEEAQKPIPVEEKQKPNPTQTAQPETQKTKIAEPVEENQTSSRTQVNAQVSTKPVSQTPSVPSQPRVSQPSAVETYQPSNVQPQQSNNVPDSYSGQQPITWTPSYLDTWQEPSQNQPAATKSQKRVDTANRVITTAAGQTKNPATTIEYSSKRLDSSDAISNYQTSIALGVMGTILYGVTVFHRRFGN